MVVSFQVLQARLLHLHLFTDLFRENFLVNAHYRVGDLGHGVRTSLAVSPPKKFTNRSGSSAVVENQKTTSQLSTWPTGRMDANDPTILRPLGLPVPPERVTEMHNSILGKASAHAWTCPFCFSYFFPEKREQAAAAAASGESAGVSTRGDSAVRGGARNAGGFGGVTFPSTTGNYSVDSCRCAPSFRVKTANFPRLMGSRALPQP